MAENELQVILKSKELAEHTLRITSNCNRYEDDNPFMAIHKWNKNE